MDELFSVVIEAIASAASPKKNPQAAPATNSVYGQILAELRAKSEPEQQAPPTPQRLAPPVPVAPPAAPAASRAHVRKETAHDREEARAALRLGGPLNGLFEDGNSLVRAVVGAEVLGPPIALRENQLWQIRRPNERST